MDLALIWFVLIAVLWTGYLVLEGFDFGVGMLMGLLAKNNKERRLALNTIGPVWDGNEVWLLTAGGATFAAFPEWYATLFSGFYLPLLLILLSLIVRAVAIEYRGKINDEKWRQRWDWAIIGSAWVPSILWGVAFANLVRGVPIAESNGHLEYVGNFFDLLSPFALLGGLVTLSLFLSHGAIFLALKTSGDFSKRAGDFAKKISVAALALAAVWAIWTQLAYSVAWTWAAVLVAALGLIAVVWFARVESFGKAFIANAVVIVGAVVLIFGSMYPDVMPSSIDPAYSLTVDNASSTDYTLTVMTWVAVIMTPIVLAYQAWSYWVFRRRISTDHIPEHSELTFLKK
ncbi:cytochrome d ubiquinol oxidase subunit II [Demequina capsici]|uniref:Cytochrome d ubiquinol oxidase subunit II n=1 Tax=Demequina capsici TaxID=3075620 RepID=A0AA96JB48_9MICO|nr:cytochrome d ubiquinol oxidase subunit II [Demequina sp. OYTSA14]WNM25396.1 cytochrome d ubiquinol oxidase subunit II [Demequina sp. OYTSA14]